MKIVVLMKEVPDTWGDRTLDLETGLLNRAGSDLVLDEITERALEVALTHRDSNPGTEVVLLAVGPATVPNSLRKGLAMGADRAVHVHDDALLGADLTLTAETLAAAIRHIGFDLVVAGNLSTDGGGGVLPSMLAELLGVAGISSLSTVEITDSTVAGRRNIESGAFEVSAALPAVISITEALPDARFSNFKGIMAAKKKPFETLSLADLGITVDENAGRSIIIAVAQRPARTAGIRIEDDGDAGQQIADFLIQNQLIKGRS
ncbi:electron transfer flavoprotein subunit beta/FixA family protein [Arthrobacter sp. zg-Y820]|uniref:electron transfer flavoprotein subunit beta/FixA family protein n=1 Tax=unclassified Arthrobacter TaxID=235627 RepID=UPI001E63FBC3|nr:MULTISPECIES: electron transfer flavoprotein subunit beta/FixA family protein [unclassified Arthrobacter]MCC9196782.1 electron transfer flavoprotein subunit beta/FixA family protein [Arthrobacter sp. zg-Y820]MDK1279644.1 electron transfer flavoprotein subunit beta/FixA family protein [Arthrobacter sp. zg.Y820]WIB11126.1 electron transfer flavoprotein subunit beta/FixA family protein [Arthrobacter sp. zg-Y820]